MNLLKKTITYFFLVVMLFAILPIQTFALAFDDFTTRENPIITPKLDKDVKVPPVSESKKETKIIRELTEKRTVNEKYFLTDNGNIVVAIYPFNIHYKKDGKYVDINNSINETDTDFENIDSIYKVKFAKQTDKNKLLTIKKGNYQLKWTLENANKVSLNKIAKKELTGISKNEEKMSIKNITSTIEYKDILNGIDVKYDLVGDQIKESIIIKNKKALKSTLKFNINTNGLEANIDKDNIITLSDSITKEVVYYLQAPFMFDKNLELSDNIKLILTKDDKDYSLEYVLDEKWINDKSRVFPITIDPTVTSSLTREQIQDTYIYNGDINNTNPRWNQHILRIGSNYMPSLYKNPARALIKFTLPELTAGDQIVDAQFNFVSYPQHWDGFAYPSSAIVFDLHKITADWNSQTANWNNSSGNYEQKVTDEIIYNYSTTNPIVGYNFDITSIAKDWYLTGNNYGLMIKDNWERYNLPMSDAYFYSSDVSDTYASYRPVVTIEYRNQTGIEGYQTYQTVDVGRAGTVYSNNYNGNLVLEHYDVQTPGTLLPVSINHVYNTNDIDTNIGYGIGYRLNLNQTIINSTIGGTGYLQYIDEDGTRHYFLIDSSTGPYKDEDGLGLEINALDGNYIMQDKDGNKSTFQNIQGTYYLIEITDSNGNKITITRDLNNYNLITNVLDGAGNELVLNYANAMLSSIKDKNNRYIYYNYTNNNLTNIKYPDNKDSYYEYSNNLLTKVKNIDNSYIALQYFGVKPFRIKKISEYSTDNIIGSSLDISYGENSTTINDNKGFSNNYVFNNYGQTTSATNFGNSNNNDNVYGKAYKYDNSTKQKMNKLALETNLIKSTNNLILNSSAEYDQSYWTTQNGGSNAGTMAISTAESYIGNKSFKVETTTKNNTFPMFYQRINAFANKTYTFSVYAKGQITEKSCTDNCGVVLVYEYKDAAGSFNYIFHRIDIKSDWNRYSFTTQLPSNVARDVTPFIGIFNAKGHVYFDGIQIEESNVANPYNLVDNGNFESDLAIWNGYLTDANDTVINDNGKSLRMIGNAWQNKYKMQQINVNGKEGDSISLGALIKTATPPPNWSINKSTSIAIDIVSTNNVDQWWGTGNISSDGNNWKYISDVFIADHDYKRIDIYLCTYFNINTALFDNITLFKDETGTSYTYDDKGNLISASENKNINSSFQYNSNNQLIQMTNPKGGKFTYTYDTNIKNRLLKAVSESKVAYNFSYDVKGNVTESKVTNELDSKYIQNNAEYSSNGNYLTKTKDQVNNEINYTYNENTGTLTNINDSKNNSTNYTYDDMDRLSTASSNNIINSYTYNNDKMNTITHNGIIYSFLYDTFGNTTQVKLNNQSLITNNYEPNNGNLLSNVYGNNHTISYAYDNFNRVKTKTNSLGAIEYLYDNKGNIGKIKDNIYNIETNYYYDLSNRLISLNTNQNYGIKYDYDESSNVTKTEYTLNSNKNTVNNTFDKDNKLLTSNNASYTYDNLSRLTNKTTTSNNNTYITEHKYKDVNTNRTTTLLESIKNGSNDKISYTYDVNGNIETILENNIEKAKYYYDEINQLVKEDNSYLNKTIEYTYDIGGNITSKKEYEYKTTNLLSTINYGYDTSWKDKLVSYNNKAITYDNIGNPLTYDGNTYTWTNGRQLSNITNGSNIYQYKYDDNGIRIEKIINGASTKYYLEGSKVIYEQKGTDLIYYTYDGEGNIVGLKYNNSDYYYLKNGQNDIIGLLDENLNQIVSYQYDSWGNIISIKDGNGNNITDPSNIGLINPYRYRSYRYDTETGLYYLNSRYYNPTWGRFINADTVMNTYGELSDSNMYAYTDNNPINRIDTNGHFWDFLLDVVSVVSDVISLIKNPSKDNVKMLVADIGLAAVPFVPTVGAIKAGAKVIKGINKVDDINDAAKVGKNGWKIGDDITALTKVGNNPTWDTVRNRYWKNEALYNSSKYNSSNIARMSKGKAPIVWDAGAESWSSMQLHHINGRGITNPHNIGNLRPLTPSQHIDIHRFGG